MYLFKLNILLQGTVFNFELAAVLCWGIPYQQLVFREGQLSKTV